MLSNRTVLVYINCWTENDERVPRPSCIFVMRSTEIGCT